MRAVMVAALLLGVGAGGALGAGEAAAQQLFSDSYTFLKAVRDRDAYKARQGLERPGSTLVNVRDRETGEMAVHIVTKRRDLPWLALMLQSGADVNGRDRDGNTPLILAASGGFVDGARVLIGRGAAVNGANNSGETALIKAVQARDAALTRLLLENGANADATDNVAGMSARDYAKRDRRAAGIARLLDETRAGPATATMGPR